MDVQDFLQNGTQTYLPNLSLDHVILGYEEGQLKCLLLQTRERWNLPGGLIKRAESVEEAVDRVLNERTGLSHGHREFLGVFGKKDRSFAEQWKQMLESFGHPWKPEYWINDRFVTLGYYSLVNIQKVSPIKGEYNQDIAWFPLQELPPMWMDHKELEARKVQLAMEDQGDSRETQGPLGPDQGLYIFHGWIQVTWLYSMFHSNC